MNYIVILIWKDDYNMELVWGGVWVWVNFQSFLGDVFDYLGLIIVGIVLELSDRKGI